MKIVETNHADKPRRRYRSDEKQYGTNLKAYVQAAVKRLRWKLITSSKK